MGVSLVCRRVHHKYVQLSHSPSQLERRIATLDFVSTRGPVNTKIKQITVYNLQKLRWVCDKQSLHLYKLKLRDGKLSKRYHWRLGVATVEKDGRWRYHYMVSAWFIFFKQVINTSRFYKSLNINWKFCLSWSFIMLEWKSKVRCKKDMGQRSQRKEIPS